MAACPLDSGESSPKRMSRSEDLPGNEPGPFDGFVPTGNLWRDGQKQLIQSTRGEEIGDQVRTAFDQDKAASAGLLHDGQEAVDADKPGARLLGDHRGQAEFPKPSRSSRGSDDERRNFARAENAKGRIDLAAACDNYVQGRARLV